MSAAVNSWKVGLVQLPETVGAAFETEEPTTPTMSLVTFRTATEPVPPHEFGCQFELTQPLMLAAVAGETPTKVEPKTNDTIAIAASKNFEVLALCIWFSPRS